MKDLVQKVMHDNKGVDGIIFLEFVTCEYSNDTWKCKHWFTKDLIKNVLNNCKTLENMILFEFVTFQC